MKTKRTAAVAGTAVLICAMPHSAGASVQHPVVGTWSATTTTNSGTTMPATKISFSSNGLACSVSDEHDVMTSAGSWRGSTRVAFRVTETFVEGGETVFVIDSTQTGEPGLTWTSRGTTLMKAADGTSSRVRVSTKMTRVSNSPTDC